MDRTVLIREAATRDLPAIAQLYAELDWSHQTLDVELRRNTQDRKAHLRAALNNERARLIVASCAQHVVGFILASFEYCQSDVMIEAISVDKGFRRHQVGTELLRYVERWARERQVRYVKLNVYEFNPEARAFYESLGYLTTSRTMQKDPQLDVSALVIAAVHLGAPPPSSCD